MNTRTHHPNSAGHPQTRDRALAFGAAIRERRRSLPGRPSQETIAGRVGVARQSISRWEEGAYSPSLHQLFRLADGLGVPLSTLLAEAERGAAKVGAA